MNYKVKQPWTFFQLHLSHHTLQARFSRIKDDFEKKQTNIMIKNYQSNNLTNVSVKGLSEHLSVCNLFYCLNNNAHAGI